MTNCTTFLDVNARLGDKPAIIHPTCGARYSFPELLEYVNRISNGLRRLNVQKGDRICIYLDSTIEYLVSYLAIWRIGAVAVPLNIVLKDKEVLYHINNADARAIIAPASAADLIEQVRKDAPTLRNVILVDGTRDGAVSWDDLRKTAPAPRAVHCGFDDLCQLQYTSGTTGEPKGAMLTHGNWMAALDAEVEVLGLGKDDIYLGIYPMAHVGVSWGMAALKAGATWVVMERFDLSQYIDLIEETGATVIAAMPPVIHSLLETPQGTEERLRSGRVMISGGGPLHPSIWKDFHSRFGIPIVNAYGLSETIVVGTGTAIRPEDYLAADEFKSVGTPVGYTEVKVVDVNDPSRVLGVNEVGEIALRGPAVAKGYWKMEEATKEVFLQDGWFLTGDIGYIDGEGMVSITDRKKDMIVMSGWKIYPTEVEKVLIEHPKIKDIAIFGSPDIRRGEIPVAAVVPAEGSTLTPEELMAFAKERLAGYKVPRRIVVLDALPRVHGWKLLRRELREKYGSTHG